MTKIDWHYIKTGFPGKLVKRLLTELKFLYQRQIRGWDVTEAWNLYNYIAQFTLPRLRYLRKNRSGFPILMFKEIGVDSWDNPTEEESAQASELWDYILGEIEWAMEVLSEDDSMFLSDKDTERLDKAKAYFGKYFESLWD